MSPQSDGLLKLFMFPAEPPVPVGKFQPSQHWRVDPAHMLRNDHLGNKRWGDGVGYCAAAKGNGDKSRHSGADARVYLYRPSSHVRLSVCLSAPKPEDGETGEDFFERVGGISQRVDSMLSEQEDGACIQCESERGSRLGSDVTLSVKRLMALWRRSL